MTDLRQAAQQALEALENLYLTLPPESVLAKSLNDRITALKAALEQQAEPVAWRDMVVVTLVREGIDKHKARELADHFATPPQRQWVGLTPEEILDLFDRNNVYGSKWIEFARTVEAKLRSKNDH
jgi:hypothetical protein